MSHKPFMQTRGGHQFDPDSVSITKIEITDIAHALSNMSRYAGHSLRFYSVAEHSVLTYNIAKKRWPQDIATQWAALLHDATEAYVVDLPTPLKRLLPKFMEIEGKVAELLSAEFKIPSDATTVRRVKLIDKEALATEAPKLFLNTDNWDNIKTVTTHAELLSGKFPMRPGAAMQQFLKAFHEAKARFEEAEKHGNTSR